MKNIITAVLLLCAAGIHAQEYIPPTKMISTGKAPGMKVKLLSANGQTKTYAIIFSTGDEIVAGLTAFAQQYNVQSAHYTAIGDAATAKIGWYDAGKKMFKVIPLTEATEITSLVGDIAIYNGKPVAHSHINLAGADGIVRGGHLLEAYVGPTVEVMMTVEPASLHKKLDESTQVSAIDLTQ